MLSAEKPLYMSNKEWYTIDKRGQLIMTDKAPPEAIKAYNERNKTGGIAQTDEEYQKGFEALKET